MPELIWKGKDKVINHHQVVPVRTLDHQYAFGGSREGESGNKIIHGDNLEALKALLPRYEGKIKCIYIDPPYNTGNEGWVYNDNVNDPRIKRWLGEVVGKEGEDLCRHDKWLCMMYPRLQMLKRLLADDGFIFVSIDYNEDACLRLLLDEIFGLANFRNCIAVRRGIKNVQAQFEDLKALSVGHEYIYLYSKRTTTRLPKLQKTHEIEKPGKWDTFWRGTSRPTMRYELLGIKPDRGQWRWEEGRAKKAAENYIHYVENYSRNLSLDEYYLDILTSTNEKTNFVRLSDDGVVQYYVPPSAGKIISDNWMDILLSGSYTDFDTEKNSLIIDRILEWILSESEKETVLDSFAGSGTTAHSLLNLNRKYNKSHSFILIEMMDYAETITAERVRRVITGYGEDNRRVEGTGGGFDYYTLGDRVFDDEGNLNEAVGTAKIRQYVAWTEKLPFIEPNEHPYWLGERDRTGFYFHYEPDRLTVLNLDFLKTIQRKNDSYLIYADTCLLDESFMRKHGIRFKKIPRDISRF